jgi:hypothetical protein
MAPDEPTQWTVDSTDGTARFKLPEPGYVLMVHSDGTTFWTTTMPRQTYIELALYRPARDAAVDKAYLAGVERGAKLLAEKWRAALDDDAASLMLGHVARADAESVAYASGGGFLSRDANPKIEEGG